MMGTITMSTEDGCTCPKGSLEGQQLKQQPVHMYTTGPTCTNVAEFTLKYNEKHLLVTNMLPAIHHSIVVAEKAVVLKIDTDKELVQLAFLVCLKSRHTVVTVESNTCMSLLLNMGCIHVEPILLTGVQLFQVLQQSSSLQQP